MDEAEKDAARECRNRFQTSLIGLESLAALLSCRADLRNSLGALLFFVLYQFSPGDYRFGTDLHLLVPDQPLRTRIRSDQISGVALARGSAPYGSWRRGRGDRSLASAQPVCGLCS